MISPFCWYSTLINVSNCKMRGRYLFVLLIGNLQKLYSVFHVLPFLRMNRIVLNKIFTFSALHTTAHNQRGAARLVFSARRSERNTQNSIVSYMSSIGCEFRSELHSDCAFWSTAVFMEQADVPWWEPSPHI